MSTIQLRGTIIAEKIQSKLQSKIHQIKAQGLRAPALAMIQVGDEAASTIYVRNKQRAFQHVGMTSQFIQKPVSISEKDLLALIKTLNQDQTIDGILVQLPLPAHIRVGLILDMIHPQKDVDGFHPQNLGLLAQNRPHFRACTPYGIMELLNTLSISLTGMHAVIVGASNIVGKPMAFELLNAGCTITICHAETRQLQSHVQSADLLISAIGKIQVIQSQWIKAGAIVIDVGMNRSTQGIVTGDIDYKSAFAQKPYAITPVPGGVGPMTVAMLMHNTWKAFQQQHLCD